METKYKENIIKKLLTALPNDIVIDILENSNSILEWECFEGYGTKIIKDFFSMKNIFGQNKKEVYTNKAKIKFKDIEFIASNQINYKYDVIINVFSEYKDLKYILHEQLINVNNYYIYLGTYNCNEINYENTKCYADDIIENQMLHFRKVYEKKFNNNDLLIIYRNENRVDEDFVINKVETWDKVAETYKSEIDDIDIEISDYILNFFNENKLNSTNSIIELGCGSGHISLKIKESGIENVSLLDFSNVALEKAKLIFNKNKANFINGDLLKLNFKDKYDVCWNSGVLEHFNDEEIELILKNIYNITNKYFICIVPNPKSLIYLLMRRNRMVNGTWDFGIEYLRTNYKCFIENAGFKIKKIDYLGKEFSKYFLREVFLDKYDLLGIDDLLIDDLYLKENNYLQVIICEVNKYE